MSAFSCIFTPARAEEVSKALLFRSPQWQEFRDAVVANHFRVIGDAELEAPRRADETKAAGWPEAAVEDCLKKALENLDASSAYYSASQWGQMKNPSGGFVGIGLEIRHASGRNGEIEIVSTLRDSAAERAGLLQGDLIISIGGKPISGVPIMEAVRSMRGEPGSVLDLRVRRAGVVEPMRFSVRREQIRLRSVKAALIAPGVLWLRIVQLREQTRSEILAEVSRLKQQNPVDPRQVILDLRGSPGGLLEALVSVAALWLPEEAAVVRTIEKTGPPGRIYRATPADYAKAGEGADSQQGILHRLPVTIVVDSKTAAGSEALAQVLREQRQAKIVGQITFGYGAIDKLFSLSTGAAFRIQIATMESPEGGLWHGKGITPDVAVSSAAQGNWEYGSLPGDSALTSVLGIDDTTPLPALK
jgi:carboxyl-terminal processing protease